MSGNLDQFPARNTSFQDKNGEINPVWYRFLFGQWAKTGGGSSTTTIPELAASIASITVSIASKVSKAGDTMTGRLVLSGAPLLPLHAATKNYVDVTAPGLAPVQSVAGRTGNVVLGYTDVSGLAMVAHTGAYSDLTGTPVTVSPATVAPLIDGTAAVGTSLLYARQDHVHPTDPTRAALASPTFTGTPAAPTATALTSTTQLATTAYADAAVGVETSRATTAEALLAPKASPSFTGNALVAGGAGFWGHASPGAQPAAPVTLANVISVLQSYGLTA